jgi:hypothetical protein
MPPHIVLMFMANLVCLAGFIALWVWKLAGGMVSLAGIAMFYTVNYAVSGRLSGGVYPTAPPLRPRVAGDCLVGIGETPRHENGLLASDLASTARFS